MFNTKLVVFSALVSLTLSAAVQKDESVGVIDSIFEQEEDSLVCQQEMAKFQKCFPEAEAELNDALAGSITADLDRESVLTELAKGYKGLECLGNVTCGKAVFLKYLVEGSLFATDRIYLGAYDCVQKTELGPRILSCVSRVVPKEVFLSGDAALIMSYARPIAKCTAENLDSRVCTSTAKNSFYQGALFVADVAHIFSTLPRSENGTTFIGFNKQFIADEYLKEHL